MVEIDTNRLKGNFAQGLVSSWLSRICLVRPVAEGTDIGIDLYCESVVGEKPFSHFWAQVKTIPPAAVSERDGVRRASFRFQKRHLEYWLDQPIPVYAFLVALDGWPPTTPTEVWGVPLTRNLVEDGLPNTPTVRYETHNNFTLGNLDEDLRRFTTEVVPIDTSVLLLSRGVIAPVKDLAASPERRFPAGIGVRFLPLVQESIMNSAIASLSLLAETRQDEWPVQSEQFEAIARVFADQMHPWGWSVLALHAEARGDINEAKSCWRSAAETLRAREYVPPEARAVQLAMIDTQLERLG